MQTIQVVCGGQSLVFNHHKKNPNSSYKPGAAWDRVSAPRASTIKFHDFSDLHFYGEGEQSLSSALLNLLLEEQCLAHLKL